MLKLCRALSLRALRLLWVLLIGILAVADSTSPDTAHEFHFARMKYREYDPAMLYPTMADIKNWFTDYGDATGKRMDDSLTAVLGRVTSVDIGDPVVKSPMDTDIFRYPFLYTVEPGQMVLSEIEAQRMREWLYRGGFWMMDDFHGCTELSHVMQQIGRVLRTGHATESVFKDITAKHAIFHTVYDIDRIVQVPYVYSGYAWLLQNGNYPTWEAAPPCNAAKVLLWEGSVWDGAGTILLAWNTDLGDSIEHADDPQYPEVFSAYSYKFFTNVVVYALTH